MKIFATLFVACIPAVISGIIVLAKSQAKPENEKLHLYN